MRLLKEKHSFTPWIHKHSMFVDASDKSLEIKSMSYVGLKAKAPSAVPGASLGSF